ncbi:MAG: TlpA family protein disulfide reductase, partial [Rhodanobacteraceae bacterium]
FKIGDLVASVARPDLDGAAHTFGQWQGKLILVNFWAAWCGPCREEMPLLDRMQQRLGGKGLQIVGVAVDNPAAIREFLARVPVRYPILVDDPELGKDLAGELGNSRSVLPYTVLLDREGRIVARRAGNFSESSLNAWLSPYL